MDNEKKNIYDNTPNEKNHPFRQWITVLYNVC